MVEGLSWDEVVPQTLSQDKSIENTYNLQEQQSNNTTALSLQQRLYPVSRQSSFNILQQSQNPQDRVNLKHSNSQTRSPNQSCELTQQNAQPSTFKKRLPTQELKNLQIVDPLSTNNLQSYSSTSPQRIQIKQGQQQYQQQQQQQQQIQTQYYENQAQSLSQPLGIQSKHQTNYEEFLPKQQNFSSRDISGQWQNQNQYEQQITNTIISQYTQILATIIEEDNPLLLDEKQQEACQRLWKYSNEYKVYYHNLNIDDFIQNSFIQAFQQTLVNNIFEAESLMEQGRVPKQLAAESQYVIDNLNGCVYLLKQLPNVLQPCQKQLSKIYISKIKNDKNYDHYVSQPVLLRLFCQVIALLVQTKLVSLKQVITILYVILDDVVPNFEQATATGVPVDEKVQLRAQVGMEAFLQLHRLVADCSNQMAITEEYEITRKHVLLLKNFHNDQSQCLWKVLDQTLYLENSKQMPGHRKYDILDKKVRLKFCRANENIHKRDILNLIYEPLSQTIISSNKLNEVVLSTLDGKVIKRIEDFCNDIFEIDQFGQSGWVLLTETPGQAAYGQNKYCHLFHTSTLESPQIFTFPFHCNIHCIKALTNNPQYVAIVSRNKNLNNSGRKYKYQAKNAQTIYLFDISRVTRQHGASLVQTFSLQDKLSDDRLKMDIRCCSKVHNQESLFLTGSQWIQMWDFRDKRTLVRYFGDQYGAHTKTCMALDGDYNKNIVVSGGKDDMQIKVWDMRQEQRYLESYDMNQVTKSEDIKLDPSCPLKIKLLKNTTLVACSTLMGLYTLSTREWHTQDVMKVKSEEAKFYQVIDWIDQGDSVAGLIAAKQTYMDFFKIKF